MKMNKTMLLGEVANRSGIPADECGVVLKTFERVLCEELTRKLYRYGGWILLLIGLFISAFAFGQISDRKGRPVQTIRGMVVDGDSKYPIPYATVRLSDKEGMGTTTDSLGRFTIPQVPVGRQSVFLTDFFAGNKKDTRVVGFHAEIMQGVLFDLNEHFRSTRTSGVLALRTVKVESQRLDSELLWDKGLITVANDLRANSLV